MKFLRDLLLAAVLSGCLIAPVLSHAAGDDDLFAGAKTMILAPPKFFTVNVNNFTNGPYDMRGFRGIAKIDLILGTNSDCTMVCALQGSTTGTNAWTTMTNFCQATQTTFNLTNNMIGWGTNTLVCTNTYNLAGTISTATPATSGFAGRFIDPGVMFTNAASFTLVGSNVVTVACSIDDQPRFWRLLWTTGGTLTNETAAAILTAKDANFP